MTQWVLGIESSCDETAVAIIGADKTVGANLVASQDALHARYAGVVPEIAARAHVDCLSALTEQAFENAGLSPADISAVAATAGPGLIGGVMVGLVSGKTMAQTLGIPYYAINHLEGHALSPRLVEDCPFPYLLLLISGGHCQILVVRGVGAYQRLSTTIDDAAGEAFDKLAKLLALGFPGGPAVERCALGGDARRFALPRPLKRKGELNFSFSGLKTAAMLEAQALANEEGEVRAQDCADLCASFQAAITDSLVDRLEKALAVSGPVSSVVVAGGVAANQTIRKAMETVAQRHSLAFHAPPLWLCGDNAAMIAWAGQERRALALPGDDLDFKARARWPLDPQAEPAPGAGVKA